MPDVEGNAKPPERPVGPGRPRRRWLRAAGWTLAAVVFLVAASYLAVPPLAKRLLVGKLGEALHRPVAVREIRFNPLRLCLTVEGFSVGERDGGGDFVAFDELYADLEAVSVFHRAPVLREVRLRGPRVHVVRREDGRAYNFSDLLEDAAKAGGEAAKAAKKEPTRFALHNIRVSGGRIQFEDRPRGATHEVADVELTIPFVSNFPTRVDTYEQPSLSAVVNGAPFRLAGQTKPFKETLETVVELDLQKIDIPRYLAYLPAERGFTVREGTLGTKLSVSFAALPEGRALVVRGAVRLDRVAVTEPAGSPLLLFTSLEVPAFTLDVFKKRLEIERVVLDAPDATLVLREGGGLNWSSAFRVPGPKPADEEPTAWQVTLGEARLAAGSVHWRDEAVPGGFSAEVEGLEAGVRSFAFPQREPAPVDLKLRTGFGESLAHRGSLLISPLLWEGDVEASGVRPRAWEAYYRRALAYEVRDGVLGATAHVRLADAEGRTGFGFSGLAARLERLKVRHRGAPADFLALAAMDVSGADLDLPARRLSLGSVALRTASLELVREAGGGVVPGVPPAAATPAPAPAAAPASGRTGGEPSWLVEAASVRLDDCGATLVDTTIADWLTHTVAPLSAEVTGFSTKKGSRASFRLAAGINGEGRLSAKGDVGLVPLGGRADVEVKNLSLVPWYPYYADRVNFVTSSGALAVKGSLSVVPGEGEATGVSFRGDAGLTDFLSVDRLNAEEMLKWKSLALGGIALESSPFSLAIDEAVLSDFYSRLVIFPDGRLNVQKAAAAAETEAEAGPDAEVAAPATKREEPVSPAPPAGASGSTAAVTIARTTLQGGTVDFSDRFIKPNYSAVLTDLAGSVSGLSSQPGTTADLEVRGRLDHSAPLSISGKINPLAGNLFLDVKAAVQDIELGRVSPYSGKYLGYGIEKGKMSFDVAYRVENRQLTAENRLVLDQLTFGERVESPEATSLPVRLAVALLKDRRGVIDVNLPIGGSLDDPDFSVGRIVLQIILNIIVKAVTSPFALIGSLFGGGAELSYAAFETGGEAPAPEGLKGIEALRTALIERPGLNLEITGRADTGADRESLRRRRFEQQLKAQKLKDTVRKGTAGTSLDAVVIEPKEYEKYLRKAYKDAKFPRPRNFIGMLKDLPLEETENLLLTNTLVTDDDLVALANRRAQAAKDLLVGGDGGVSPERVFLLAPVVAGADSQEARPAARVDFTLK